MLRLLTQRKAASLLRLSERTLERLRVTGRGPIYVKTGRFVRYRETDLLAWLDRNAVGSTTEVRQ
jgi:predicted DNA-binding transcriptional regulator AlpA